MKPLIFYNRKLIRYRSFLSILFSMSRSPTTPNPSFLFTCLNSILRSHQFHTNPSLCDFSTGSPPNKSMTFPICKIYGFPVVCIGLSRSHCLFSWFSVLSSNGSLPSKSVENAVYDNSSDYGEMGIDIHNQVSDIVEVIRSGKSDLNTKFSFTGTSLSVRSIREILRVLNCEGISALGFFKSVKCRNPGLFYNYKVCSLSINHCGWLEDYGSMSVLLKEFRSKGICLTEEAFEFLPVLTSCKASVMESVKRVVELLNEVGGSCRGSGICSLIKMLCALDSFEIAKYVIEITKWNESYYNTLIRERCRRCHFEEVYGLIEEKRELGCEPNVETYNYLLGSLCKNDRISEACTVIELMQERDTPPDALTFDIVIYFSCRLGNFDLANEFLARLMSRALEPRLSTHAIFVKSYFYAGKCEDAHKYVRTLDNRYGKSKNMIYSLLASLYQKKGDLIVARDILIEMMEVDLKPEFLVYIRIVEMLQKKGKRSLAEDLKRRFSRFTIESSATTG